ncbi:mechanosensitive ion channel family protein [Methylolobus aquaticus]|nr:mechanosensitive ion channel family protein [Methylolobus aquaticus]
MSGTSRLAQGSTPGRRRLHGKWLDMGRRVARCSRAAPAGSAGSRGRLWRVLLSLWIALLATQATPAQTSSPTAKPLVQQIKDWNAVLNRVRGELADPELSDEQLDAVPMSLAPVRAEARMGAEGLLPEVQQLKDEQAALGPPPPADAPPEAANIAERRKASAERLATVEGAIKEAELIVAQTDRLLDEVSALRRVRFTDRLSARSGSPLSAKVWQRAWSAMQAQWVTARTEVGEWWTSKVAAPVGRTGQWVLPLSVAIAVLLAWPARSKLLRRFGYISVEGEPNYGQRLQAALFTGLIRSFLPSAAALAFYLGVRQGQLLSAGGLEIAWATVQALVFVAFTHAFCWGAFAPNAPSWRLVPLTDAAAMTVSRTVTGLAAVFGLDWIISTLNEQTEVPVELILLEEFVSGLLIAALLFALLRPGIWRVQDGSRWRRHAAATFARGVLTILVGAIPLTAVLGYVALSRVLATQLVLSAGLVVGLALLRALGDEMIEHALLPGTPLALRVRTTLDMTRDGCEMLAFWLRGLLRLALLVSGLLALPLVWGAGGQDLLAWLERSVFGYPFPSVKISLADLVVALVLFAVLLLGTRLLQRTLDREIFPRTRLDAGVRNSIRAAAGYIGFTIALTLAVATLGIDLSNLAIIAGALSVGVGFGLQNIVGNFVSGIILLVERPVKVGDWIVVGELQGYVKRISVRATEISTFDRASVFIPNSSLIASPVVNRTYADPQGRLVIPLAVAYGCDTQRVRSVLMNVAKLNPDVLDHPPPVVLFRSFGDSALAFELVVYIPDVNRSLAVTSDLCFAIEEDFRRAGIEFPFPHRDVHLQFRQEQIDRLVEALAAVQRRS